MKKTNKHFPFILAVLFLTIGCDDYLDTDLVGQYSTPAFYKTEAHAVSAINATYNIAAFNSTNNNLWVFGDVASDDTVKGGFDGDQSDIGYVNDFNVDASNGIIGGFWQHYYEGIARANNVIYYVPDIEMDSDLKDRIIAEAKFLRAYYYFHLTNIFGQVPLKLVPALTPEDLNVPLSTVTDIYTQIEQDLTEAESSLPESYTSEVGRATKGAALGLLAKVYLFQEKWQLAADTAAAVEDLGYSLTSLYRDNFTVETENNEESIFEIQHLAGQVAPALGTYLNQWFSPTAVNGYFFNAPTTSFVEEFETTSAMVVDPRLDYSIGREGNKWVNGQDFIPEWSPTTYLSKKQVQDISPIGDGDLNYTFMRFAEVLLIKAEALNELGKGAEALIPLNEIRKRARESYLFDEELSGFGTIPTDLLPDVTGTSKNGLRAAIRHERRVELGLEFHRYYDVVRYGKAYAEEALKDTGFKYDENRYFTLPQSEKDTNTAL